MRQRLSLFRIGVAGFFCLLQLIANTVAADTGASNELLLRIGVENPAADDGGPGSSEEPLRSLGEAARRAMPVLEEGGTVTIEIEGGVYRGGAEFASDGPRRGTLVIRGVGDNAVILRGSHLVSGWRVEGDFFVRDFDHLPAADLESGVLDEPLILFVQDVRVMRSSAETGMWHGVFRVNRDRGRITMLPPQNAPLLPTNVEMATPLGRPLLRVSGVEKFECTDVVVERLGGGRGSYPGMEVRNVGVAELSDVGMQWNGWGGGWFEDIDKLNLLRVSADHNGGYGMKLRAIGELRALGCSFVLNNWRGAESGGWMDASTFGLNAELIGKSMLVRCRVIDNHATGAVFDSELGDVAIERTTIAGNRGDGLRVAARSFVGDEIRSLVNGGAGVRLTILVGAVWKYGMIYGNAEGALVLEGSGATVWNVQNSITVGTEGPAVKIDSIMPGDWNGTRNLYYREDGNNKAFNLDGKLLTLDQWTRETGSDSVSRFTDPLLDRAGDFNFSLSPDSPWHRHLEWQPR